MFPRKARSPGVLTGNCAQAAWRLAGRPPKQGPWVPWEVGVYWSRCSLMGVTTLHFHPQASVAFQGWTEAEEDCQAAGT